jgi:hypothetical protein
MANCKNTVYYLQAFLSEIKLPADLVIRLSVV